MVKGKHSSLLFQGGIDWEEKFCNFDPSSSPGKFVSPKPARSQEPATPGPSGLSQAGHAQGPMLKNFFHPLFINVCNKVERLFLVSLSSLV